jgi:hypothetical protein
MSDLKSDSNVSELISRRCDVLIDASAIKVLYNTSIAEILSLNYSMDLEQISLFYYNAFKSHPTIDHLKVILGIIPR